MLCIGLFVAVVVAAWVWYPPLHQTGFVVSNQPFLQVEQPDTDIQNGIETQWQNKVNINTAGIEQLCLLPNIGEKRAQAIIEYREQHGPFKDVQELLNISGIGPATLEGLLDFITL